MLLYCHFVPGLEGERLLGHERLVVVDLAQQLARHALVGVVEVRAEARGVAQQVLDAHLREVGLRPALPAEELRDGVLEGELALVHQLADHDRREHLVHRAQVELAVEAHRDAVVAVGDPARGLEDDLAVLRQEGGAGEGLGLGETVEEGAELGLRLRRR